MKPDLLVSIPSRNRHIELMKLLKHLYSICVDKNSFDIQIILDTDNYFTYNDVIIRYPDLIYTFIPYADGSWLNIFNAEHKTMLKYQYYFMWFLPDDITGITPNWDRDILSKKKAFKDDLFMLYTHGAGNWGRSLGTHENCYTNIDRADLVDVHEPNPVWTYKWCEFIAPLFEPPSVYITYRELIMAQILRQLFIKYGINRNVECGINYANIVNDGNSAKMCGFWDVLKEHKYDTLISVVNRMKEYVDANK